jgi:hypothetical protein
MNAEANEETRKKAAEIYDSFRDELLKRQLSNTENYDKSILTLSSSGLAISLTFLKTIIPIDEANHLWMIKTSWLCFLFSITLSIIAYLISNAAIDKQLEIAENYYIRLDNKAFNEKNYLSIANECINKIVGILFILAIVATILFVTLNINQTEPEMSHNNENKTNSGKLVLGLESAGVPRMQRIPEPQLSINSAQIPRMQAIPVASSQPQSEPQNAQTPSNDTSSNDRK